MSMSGDPVLERVRAIEDDFADAMSRMYGVGNELARLRSHLATEATPEHRAPTAAPSVPVVEVGDELPAASATPHDLPAQTAPVPGLVTPPPASHAPAAAAAPPAPAVPLPPTIPWWQRDGLVAKLLAVVGAAITLIGVAFLLALAIQMGYFGPVARVVSGALLAGALVGAAVLVRRRPAGTVGALGLASTGIATAYLDVLAVTYVYAWVPLAVGMVLAGLIALGGVLLARAWDSQLLATIAVLGVALMAPFVGIDHGLLTGAFLLVLTAATWPAHIGRRWHVLEAARIVPTALFLSVLAVAAERAGLAALLAVLLALLVVGSTLAGARTARLPDQLGVLLPVGIAPAVFAGLAADDRWVGAGLLVVATCLLVLVAVLADQTPGTPIHLRLQEIALATAGVTSLLTALRPVTSGEWAVLAIVGTALVWAVTALVSRHVATLVVASCLAALATIAGLSLLPFVVLRGEAGFIGGAQLASAIGLVALHLVLARALTGRAPALEPALPRALVAIAVLSAGAAVVLGGALLGSAVDDARGGFTAGQTGATVLWMAIAATLLLRGLRGSAVAVPAGLALAALAVGKLLFFDLSFLSGIPRVLSFIVAGLLLLGMGVGYAQALERTRREQPAVDNPPVPSPIPPTV
ncbi:DUF2339 domain-containing protein [Janibacter sp. LM]|uniref:DUF2339 domain-containing protein n=1 Tax=Janibacter sp. LM TaxID=3144845 RepID=UPI0031F652D4